MPGQKKKQVQPDTDISTDQLPTTDGTQLDLGIWLRRLSNSQHLLPQELFYFLITGALATKDHKTVVCSLQHGLLLKQGYLHQQGFSVVNPPPIDDGFAALYQTARADGIAVPIAPTEADLPAASYPISSDRIKAVDMQLMNELLSLITSTGRRMDYAKRAQNSGIALIKLFIHDKNKGLTPYAQSPYNQSIKLLLADALTKEMTQISQRQFDAIRDHIEELNCQLPDNEQLTSAQRAEHYRKLLFRLKSDTIRMALTVDMTTNQVPHDDADETVQSITRVLTSQIVASQIGRLRQQWSCLQD